MVRSKRRHDARIIAVFLLEEDQKCSYHTGMDDEKDLHRERDCDDAGGNQRFSSGEVAQKNAELQQRILDELNEELVVGRIYN